MPTVYIIGEEQGLKNVFWTLKTISSLKNIKKRRKKEQSNNIIAFFVFISFQLFDHQTPLHLLPLLLL